VQCELEARNCDTLLFLPFFVSVMVGVKLLNEITGMKGQGKFDEKGQHGKHLHFNPAGCETGPYTLYRANVFLSLNCH
jgi:hypothetical protein